MPNLRIHFQRNHSRRRLQTRNIRRVWIHKSRLMNGRYAGPYESDSSDSSSEDTENEVMSSSHDNEEDSAQAQQEVVFVSSSSDEEQTGREFVFDLLSSSDEEEQAEPASVIVLNSSSDDENDENQTVRSTHGNSSNNIDFNLLERDCIIEEVRSSTTCMLRNILKLKFCTFSTSFKVKRMQ